MAEKMLPFRQLLKPGTPFHAVLQQNGSLPVQEQCFWNCQKPIPVFDQSVARHVGLLLSKILTPSSISLMIAAFQ
jgi:hypothetical protein